jgi:hypothetical protein
MERLMFSRTHEDNANKAVRSFYDLHPYPSPVEDLEEYRRQWPRQPYWEKANEQALHFDGIDWSCYVPLRLPDIIISRNRLPEKAAVLVNPANGDPGLALPLDELELQLFNAIDSHRTIADILHRVAAESGKKKDAIGARARLLFEQLWWYDLVCGFILPFGRGPAEGANS